jgi:tetratricopeptide (TPR) repeat protein
VTSTHLALAGVTGRTSVIERTLEESRARAAGGRQIREYLIDVISVGLSDVDTRGRPEEGVARVEAALESFPLEELEPFDRPYLELAEFYARAGHADRGREMLAEFDREVPDDFRPLADIEYQRANGFVALAEGRTGEALERFRLSDRGNCLVCVVPGLARLYDQLGNADSLMAVLERYVNMSDDDRFAVDALELPGAYVRLGELYEARGERQNAVEYYDRFVNLWQNADAEFQPQVEDVRMRIARLTAEASGGR